MIKQNFILALTVVGVMTASVAQATIFSYDYTSGFDAGTT